MTSSMDRERTKAAREARPQRKHAALERDEPTTRRPDLPPAAAAVLRLQRSIGNQATVRALRSADRTSEVSPLVLQRKPTDTPGGKDSTEIWSALGELVKVYNQHAGSGGSSAPKTEVTEPVSGSGGGTEGSAPTTTTWQRGTYGFNQSGGGGERGTSTPIGQQRRAFNLPRSPTGAGPSALQDEVAGKTVPRPGAGAEPLTAKSESLPPKDKKPLVTDEEREYRYLLSRPYGNANPHRPNPGWGQLNPRM